MDNFQKLYTLSCVIVGGGGGGGRTKCTKGKIIKISFKKRVIKWTWGFPKICNLTPPLKIKEQKST